MKLIGWHITASPNYWVGAAYYGPPVVHRLSALLCVTQVCPDWIGAAYEGPTFGLSGYVYFKFGLLGIDSAAMAGNPI